MKKNRESIKKKASDFLLHPMTLFVLSFVVSLIFYWISKESIVPMYSASYTEHIVKANKNMSHMTILWDGRRIQNLKSVKVAFWNAGKKLLEQENISKANPLRIVSSQPVDILAVSTLQTSRDNLKFKLKIGRGTVPEENGVVSKNAKLSAAESASIPQSEVLVQVADDEALEHGDGGIFQVFYTGDQEVSFKVLGRVKGVPQGIQEFPIEGFAALKGFLAGLAGKIWTYVFFSVVFIFIGFMSLHYVNTVLGWLILAPAAIAFIALLVPQLMVLVFNYLVPVWIVF